jgi:hypothetical protein
MANPRIAVWINAGDYAAFAQLIPNDPDFPDAFDVWYQQTTEQIAKLEARGVIVKKVVVDPQKFAAYCRASGLKADYTSLHAFAISLDRRG